ncbi:MAG: hypothetical protein EZS26_002435 [Candidatus Ordinivivax streblomastigis]|uniref:Uncharacterized protein n=1 Tax=Candidatus Ordinivivax streblomastigis TaxID=2540710 RepID=A0A5M8NZ72_9BACT|nr:MAG: hypothetical protein EZS26_002435 [Candidatus Ordinivivax streblomastigis]
MNVFIGKKNWVPVRLILGIVQEEVYKQRIRQKTQKSKGQGRGQLTEGTKTRSRFSLFITNAGREALASDAFYILEITLSC